MGAPATLLPALLAAAWLLPLASFTVIVLLGPTLGKAGKFAAYIATGAIVTSCLLSVIALLGVWLPAQGVSTPQHAEKSHSTPHESGAPHTSQAETLTLVSAPAEAAAEKRGEDHAGPPAYYAGDWYALYGDSNARGVFGKLKITIGYYIDALTVTMFCMITLIASCIHFYAMGYMHEELHDVTDHEVTLSNGEHLHRKGRFYRFFQFLSLFCFSMLGIVIAGNIAMVFVFWELVGICSYFLIGFYIERKSASNAANKAFIVNRVGDFGMIIGLMALWGSLGTFAFGDAQDAAGHVIVDEQGAPAEPGLFSLVRPATYDGHDNHYRLVTPEGMVAASIGEELATIDREHSDLAVAASERESRLITRGEDGAGYWLLVIAGLGIFCGCVGKSAQFPLHVWLPDAMEGPTPVSALVHSATMVAAGVYLVGRFYPVFAPEVLLTIAYIGCVTLFLAATIAITATDIKRVLAYSTVSQLGYMMLALGVGGWLAGMFHLLTHAFFKSLLFLCSGSVIHAVHSNEMTEMGGLRRKMPWTAYTMLVGCLAIIGAGIPLSPIGMSGYYSKDSIIEQALHFANHNPAHSILFYTAAGGAAITAFYMFRMWYMTFAGTPRNQERYDHAHESPRIMVAPLVVLAVFATGVAWTLPSWFPGPLSNLGVTELLESARPAGAIENVEGGLLMTDLIHPNEHDSHKPVVKTPAGIIAFSAAMSGLLLATVIYCWNQLDPDEIRQQFRRLHRFLINKWWFDEIYNAIFVQPVMFIARRIAQFDKLVIDGIIHAAAWLVTAGSRLFDLIFDRTIVDGTVNTFARRTWGLGLRLHRVQTGRLRQYVMFIVVGTVALFVLISFVWSIAIAG
jgi:NADH-quinone oxidoreductase subunit L